MVLRYGPTRSWGHARPAGPHVGVRRSDRGQVPAVVDPAGLLLAGRAGRTHPHPLVCWSCCRSVSSAFVGGVFELLRAVLFLPACLLGAAPRLTVLLAAGPPALGTSAPGHFAFGLFLQNSMKLVRSRLNCSGCSRHKWPLSFRMISCLECSCREDVEHAQLVFQRRDGLLHAPVDDVVLPR